MLEQYLQNKGITPDDIYKMFPEIEDNVRNYLSIREMSSGDAYKDELNKLSNELVSFLKKNESKINAHLQEFPNIDIVMPNMEIAAPMEFAEIIMPKFDIDITMPEINIQPEKQFGNTIGFYIEDAELTPQLFLKILTLADISVRWKINPKDIGNKYIEHFWIGENAYLVTNQNPFNNKITDIYVFSDSLDEMQKVFNIIQSKILSFKDKKTLISGEDSIISKEDAYSEEIDIDSIEPVTQIPYKLVDETIEEIWKIKSAQELLELVTLSKKYGCGCGSI